MLMVLNAYWKNGLEEPGFEV